MASAGKLSCKRRSTIFLKYTAQMIIKDLRNNYKNVLEIFRVNAKDRKYQIWERNALSVSLWTQSVFKQKLGYIHSNPVAAGVCSFAEDYKYSSASFYIKNTSQWEFITHYNA